jgi:hypothetical protein
MSLATARVVVQIALADKRKIEAKTKRMDLPLSEMMRRAAFSYTSDSDDADLGALADRAKQSADNSGAAIDDVLNFIAASNKRIMAMERAVVAQAAKHGGRSTGVRLAHEHHGQSLGCAGFHDQIGR